MVSRQKLFSIGNFDFRLQHLLVLGILVCSFSISTMMRTGPLAYDTQLFEYDPFFNYRATEYIINNGFQNYLEWHDEKSWHPFGRNVSETSQVTLHVTAAYLYQIFGFGMSLYTFTILFPVVIGGMSSIAVFALVRVLGGTTAGLLASLMFSISIPILIRGFAGWFKSEPLGIFFGIVALYLFVSAIKYNKGSTSFVKLIGGALLLSLSLSAWGGSIFFLISIMLFYFAIPFFKNEKKFIMTAVPIFSISLLIFGLMFERSYSSLIGYVGLLILLSTGFVIIAEIIKSFSHEKNRVRNCIIFLGSIIASGFGIFVAGYVGFPTFRYLNVINPLLHAQDPLTESVQEHAVTNMTVSFVLLSIFLIFGLIGIWLLFSKKSFSLKNDMKAFSLIVSIFAFYISSAFVRLELFASIGLLILGGIGLSILLKEVYSTKNPYTKYIFSLGIICLFIIPITLPTDKNWMSWADYSPTIMNGGGNYDTTFTSDDWIQTMKWIKQNTPEDAVIASWWDYGYWITTLSDRTTLVDNATLNDWQIKKMAYSLLASPSDSWNILSSSNEVDVSSSYNEEFLEIFSQYDPERFGEELAEVNRTKENCENVFAVEHNLTGKPMNFCDPGFGGMGADYILIFVTTEKIYAEGTKMSLHQMLSGGDESKKSWFEKIANQPNIFTLPDDQTPTSHFMLNTTLGKLLPFEIAAYFHPSTGMITNDYGDDAIAIYTTSVKFSDSENDPFYLVYASPSFYNDMPGQKNMVLVYKINPDYRSNQEIP